MFKTASIRINIASLGVLQVFNYALTLSTLPYLARTLGVAGWGRVVFVQMVINYLMWVANWGFYLGATKRVAAERADRGALSHTFLTTWVAQWCLTGLLAGVLFISINVVPMLADHKDLYLAGAGLLLGNALTPLWYLNGLEKIRESAIIQMAVKVLALPLIFTLVKEGSGTVTYLAINSACAVTVGVFTMWWIHRSGAIRWHVPHLRDVLIAVAQEYRWFISSLWANLNGSLIPTALGIVGGAAELGYYNLADRVRSAAITILHPITKALFPRMCYLFHHDQAQALRLLKRSGIAMLVLSGIMSVTLLLFSSDILGILGGNDFRSGASALMWLAFTPVFTTASSFIIHQILVPSGNAQGYNKAMFLTLFLNAVLVVPAVSFLGAQGAAIASFSTELFAAIYLIIYVWRHKLLAADFQSNGDRN
jgi:PST family polysaccharide transporter